VIATSHDHAYMRTQPLALDKVDHTGRAPVHLILGAGGNHEGHPWGYRHFEKEVWVAKRTMQDYGYGNLFMANATHAHFSWIRDRTTDNEFEDTVWFLNPHSESP
jgi:acid phosphatase type 7